MAASSLPAPCLSSKYDSDIKAAVSRFWPDFLQPQWWKAQLCQESHLNPDATSPVGAAGLAQIMPATYAEIIRELHWDSAYTAYNPGRAIAAGAYYQGRTRRFWAPSGRTPTDRHRLGLAGYNAGNGNIVKAQARCADARLWEAISPCLQFITGSNSRETITYVDHITTYAPLVRLP